MKLVQYTDSSEDEQDKHHVPPTQTDSDPPSHRPYKRRRGASDEASASTSDLPPALPAAFHDLYTTNVRTSVQDDPNMHGGRKRLTPHVVGNWSTHVYLEWQPERDELQLLSNLIASESQRRGDRSGTAGAGERKHEIHSLIENDRGVLLPLHVSLSRPIVLKTHQKAKFLSQMQRHIARSQIQRFDASLAELAWHANEAGTRWFLVLRVQRPEGDELNRLLKICNDISQEHGQPLLYQTQANRQPEKGTEDDPFHVSIAWSLSPPLGKPDHLVNTSDRVIVVGFKAVKIRIGQEVTGIPLASRRER